MQRIGVTMISGVEVTASQQESSDRTRLRSLVLDENLIRPLSVARLAQFIGISTKLTSLSLRSCGIDDNCLSLICNRIVYLRELQKMDFTDNRITDLSIKNSFVPLLES
jgi:Ran GTPase-activating protein (RanGAP) involved in mRNA processing and transport